MSIVVERYTKIKSNISSLKPIKPVNIIAVSKTFPLEHIHPLIEYGHIHYGENKVQEAKTKFLKIKEDNQKISISKKQIQILSVTIVVQVCHLITFLNRLIQLFINTISWRSLRKGLLVERIL